MKKASVFLAGCALACVGLTTPALAGPLEVTEAGAIFPDQTVTIVLSQDERVLIEAEVSAIDTPPSTSGSIQAKITIDGKDGPVSHGAVITPTKEATVRLVFVTRLEGGKHEIKLFGVPSNEAKVRGGSLKVRVLEGLRR